MEIRIIYLLLGGLLGLVVGIMGTWWYFAHYMIADEPQEKEGLEKGTFPLIKVVPLPNPSQIIKSYTDKKNSPNYFQGRFGLTPKQVTKDAMKKELEKWVEKLMKKEQFLEVNEVQETINSCDEWFDDRKQWFIDQAGKIVFQNNIECDCPTCQDIEQNGFQVVDPNHAMDLFLTECVERSPNNPIIFTSEKQ